VESPPAPAPAVEPPDPLVMGLGEPARPPVELLSYEASGPPSLSRSCEHAAIAKTRVGTQMENTAVFIAYPLSRAGGREPIENRSDLTRTETARQARGSNGRRNFGHAWFVSKVTRMKSEQAAERRAAANSGRRCWLAFYRCAGAGIRCRLGRRSEDQRQRGDAPTPEAHYRVILAWME
jgi:hypothetical protein